MDWGQLLTVAVVFIGGIGYSVGAFVQQRRKAAGDALGIALQEIQALRVRIDRQAEELAALSVSMERVAAENTTLRELLSGGTFLAEQIRTLIHDEVEQGAHTVITALKTAP